MPRSRMAMARADICASASTPRVYASTIQSIWASLSGCPSRLDRMTSTAANSVIAVLFPYGRDALGRGPLAGPGQPALGVHDDDARGAYAAPGHRLGRRAEVR